MSYGDQLAAYGYVNHTGYTPELVNPGNFGYAAQGQYSRAPPKTLEERAKEFAEREATSGTASGQRGEYGGYVNAEKSNKYKLLILRAFAAAEGKNSGTNASSLSEEDRGIFDRYKQLRSTELKDIERQKRVNAKTQANMEQRRLERNALSKQFQATQKLCNEYGRMQAEKVNLEARITKLKDVISTYNASNANNAAEDNANLANFVKRQATLEKEISKIQTSFDAAIAKTNPLYKEYKDAYSAGYNEKMDEIQAAKTDNEKLIEKGLKAASDPYWQQQPSNPSIQQGVTKKKSFLSVLNPFLWGRKKPISKGGKHTKHNKRHSRKTKKRRHH